jgi:YqjK-like protein
MAPRDLLARQNRLLKRSAALRLRASAELQQMEPAFALGDRLLQAGTWLRRNPVYLASALAVLVVLKPRAVLGTATRAWSIWQSWQHARRWIAQTR